MRAEASFIGLSSSETLFEYSQVCMRIKELGFRIPLLISYKQSIIQWIGYCGA